MRLALILGCLCLSVLCRASGVDITLWVARDVAPSSKVRLVLNTKNAPFLAVAVAPIDGEAWLRTYGTTQPKPATTGPTILKWTAVVASPGTKPNPNQADTYYSRQINLPKLRPGVYLVTARLGAKEAWGVVNVTSLAVVAKRSPKQTLVWVTRAATGEVVPGATVALPGLPIVKTNRDGVAISPSQPGRGNVIIREGRDLAVIPIGVADPDGRLVVQTQTDRPIYRPGQTVNFKMFVRRTLGRTYRVPAGEMCHIEVRDAKDLVTTRLDREISAMGTVTGSFRISSEGSVGPYSIVFSQGRDTAYRTFTVAEYRKPEFKVEAKSTQNRALSGEVIGFDLDARTYFGTPVSNARITYHIRRQSINANGSDDDGNYSGDGNFYPRDTYSENAYVAGENIVAGKDGKAHISLKTDPAASESNYIFTATVADASNREVAASASIPVYPAAVRIGLSSPLSYASLGELIPVDVRRLDLDSKPAPGTVLLELFTLEYDKEGKARERSLTKTEVKVGAKGRERAAIPAREAGVLYLRATSKDATGRVAKATLELYVAGNFADSSKVVESPSVELKLDRRSYSPGDTAHVLAKTNRPGVPMLLVQEGPDIGAYRVIRRPKSGEKWDVPLPLSFSPNAYLSVFQWVKGNMISMSQLVPVPDRSRQLTVTVKPDRSEYKPGDVAKFTLRVRDIKGRPAAAEVALGVVDEAIYALSPDDTPDAFRLFWGVRPNLVQTAVSMPEEVSGGAYQRVESVAPIRSKFEDTGLWRPTVSVGSSGEATVETRLPDNLTTWRATARAITMDTSVGAGIAKVFARRMVTLRLAAPRQAVVGDQWRLTGTVDNRDKVAHDFTVSLEAAGLQVTGPKSIVVRVEGGQSGKVVWPVTATSLSTEGATLTARVTPVEKLSVDYADALRISVPIVPNGLPERSIATGIVERRGTVKFRLPDDRIEPGSDVRIAVSGGVQDLARNEADSALREPMGNTLRAAHRLLAAAMRKREIMEDAVQDAVALLSRSQTPEGWGWWERATPSASITADVVHAIGWANRHGLRQEAGLLKAASNGAIQRLNATQLWEARARLAAAVTSVDPKEGAPRLDEVLKRGEALSPYARLSIAEALVQLNRKPEALQIVRAVRPLVSDGPSEAYLPAGEGTGWTADDTETTAQLLIVLHMLASEKPLQAKLVRWLAAEGDAEGSTRAFFVYSDANLAPSRVGNLSFLANGRAVPADGRVPATALINGENEIVVERDGDGEGFAAVQVRVFRPVTTANEQGLRVIRRLEVMNEGGRWVEVTGTVKVGVPVRCTVVIWGDELLDAIRLVHPIPTGFEFVDADDVSTARQEVRDGAVVEYLMNAGSPRTFRFYLRAESEGTITVLPAYAEYLRRPNVRGQSLGQPLMVIPAK